MTIKAMFNPQYQLTNKIVAMLSAIAEAKAVIERAKLLPAQELRLRRQALIRMTHSSTSIEGNRLNIRQVEAIERRQLIDAPERDIYEVKNYLAAVRHLTSVVEKKQPLTEKVILKIHKLVTAKTLPPEQSGHYRRGMVYVVKRRLNRPPETVYTAPRADAVPQLMSDLVAWVKRSEQEDINPIMVAGIVHQEIAAIHPFSDGNGRTARALATLLLYQRGYDFRRLFALEDYYNQDRPAYYQAINIGKNYESRRIDFTPWLEYFIQGFKEEIDSTKQQVATLALKKVDSAIEAKIFLTPEQLKIMDFLDQVGRITAQDAADALACPKRTAQLYLQKLKKLKIITAIGKGPASAYILAK